MAFFKVKIRQQAEGQPGFVGDEEFDIQIDASKITLFNENNEDSGSTLVRLTCGATICVSMQYSHFVKRLQTALKADPCKIVK